LKKELSGIILIDGGDMKKKLHMIIFGLLLISAAAVFISGCQTSVSRIRTGKKTDLSGRWNDTDSRLVAQQMVDGLLSASWTKSYKFKEGHKPVVIIGSIENLTSEHIESGTFVKDIERELVNSGKVKFVAGKQEREDVREEREDQQDNATRKTSTAMAKELGADVMLIGSIKSHIDTAGRKQVRFYQVDMELIDIETNEKLWIESKEIKKFVEKQLVKW
jgi:penicillin-binding protein activator